MLQHLTTLLTITGGITVGWLAYAWAVPEPADLLPDRLSKPPDARSDANVIEDAAFNLDSPIVDGNEIELLENGVEIFPAMIDAIDRAEHSVHFLTYVYWTGPIAEQMASALESAARRGVEVRVLLDAYGARQMKDEVVRRIRESGAQVEWFHPIEWFQLRRLNNRTHRKVLVVDGRVGFTGGVGIAEEWEGDARHEGEWRDNHYRLRGPVVRYLQGAFAENWRDATGEVLVGRAVYPELEQAGDARIVPLTTSPAGDMSPIGFLYWFALGSANERVDIATPYFLPDETLADAIADAARNGVKIRLLVPGDLNDSALLRAASLGHYDDLIEAGVEIHEFEVSMMHAKTVIIDDRWAIIGSANMDNRSFELNDEIALLVEDTDLVRRLDEGFERDLERARQVELSEIEGRSGWSRLKTRLAALLREQL